MAKGTLLKMLNIQLNEEEAQFLLNYLQNCLFEDEPPEHRMLREELFTVLKNTLG